LFNPERLFNRLEKRGYEIKKLTSTHYRVEAVLDLYPVHDRWHNIADGNRGSWRDLKTDHQIAAFIDAQIAIADAILDKAIADDPLLLTILDGLPTEPQPPGKKWLTKEPWFVTAGKKR